MVDDFVEEDSGNEFGMLGYILFFSILSNVIMFTAVIFFASMNNYALSDLYYISQDFISEGLMPSVYSALPDQIANNILDILQYVDVLWFGSFCSMVIGSLIYSYGRKRENYFSLISMLTLGLIVIIYAGSFVIQVSNWFNGNIFLAVFPTLATILPKFNWYINNIGIINLVLVVSNIIANYVNLDFSKFNRDKGGESLDEI